MTMQDYAGYFLYVPETHKWVETCCILSLYLNIHLLLSTIFGNLHARSLQFPTHCSSLHALHLDEKCNNDLIGLSVLIHFSNLVLVKFNVCMLAAKEMGGVHVSTY